MNTILMLKWIVLNRQMSMSEKLEKTISVFLIQIGKRLRKGSVRIYVLAHREEYPLDLLRLLRNIELLRKKGYVVRLMI